MPDDEELDCAPSKRKLLDFNKERERERERELY
jgi:hypothetical protein